MTDFTFCSHAIVHKWSKGNCKKLSSFVLLYQSTFSFFCDINFWPIFHLIQCTCTVFTYQASPALTPDPFLLREVSSSSRPLNVIRRNVRGIWWVPVRVRWRRRGMMRGWSWWEGSVHHRRPVVISLHHREGLRDHAQWPTHWLNHGYTGYRKQTCY